MKFTSPTQQQGRKQEDLALEYLTQQGLQLIVRNYQLSLGEIDLIMLDNKTIVFIEVRARLNHSHGDALESINKQKQRKLIHCATYYLQRHKLLNKVHSRFDVLAINQKSQITWIKSAFMLD